MKSLASGAAVLLLLGMLLVSSTPHAVANTDYDVGDTATVANTNGSGVRLRDGAGTGAAIILVVPEGAAVKVTGEARSGDGYTWYPVAYGGATGYVAGAYLGGGGGGAVVQAAARKTPAFEAGAHVQVSGTGGADLRIRGTYSFDGAVLGYAPAGSVLEVLGGPRRDGAGNGWYEVDYDGLAGYASAAYLSWTDDDLSARRAAPKAEAPAAKAAAKEAPATGGNGQAMVSVAMQYVGSPYVWAGASPSGFDCSGFTMYVAQKALGKSISHALGTQVGLGTAVGAKELQPGDLVFFQNTYQAGLSHVGIYIGGGQMVHAGSERTGVVVSNIWDNYWGPKFYAARRL